MSFKTGLVYLGDCREVLRGFTEGCVDAIITDFPFDMVPDDSYLSVFDRVLKQNSWIVFWFPFKSIREYLNAFAGRFEFVWIVNHIKYNSGRFCPIGFSKTESIMVFKKGKPKLNFKLDDAIIHPVFRISKAEHPFKKDECVVEQLVRAFSAPGDVVLDPMCGSGSILTVARRLGRDFVGVEIDPDYFRMAVDRLKKP